jgi:hypothetical protein
MVSRLIARALVGVASFAFGAGIVIALSGGWWWPVGPLVLRFGSASRPLMLGAVTTAVLIGNEWRSAKGSSRLLPVASRLVAVAFGTLLCAAFGLVLHSMVTACGGLDSYGYVSAADLLLSGRLVERQPIAALMPFEAGIRALTPLGYVPGRAGDVIVPRFPLGFPLVIALSVAVFGKSATWFVAPTLAIGTAALAYVTALRVTSPVGALLSTALVATSPVLVNSAIQPMSDVPAAFWLTAAICAMWGRRLPFVAGVCAGMAVWTRPLLMLAAIVIGFTPEWRRQTLLKYGAGLIPAVAGLLALQWSYYGHPFMSGYGSAGQLFALSAVAANARNYAYWISLVLTPLFPLSVLLAYRYGNARFAAFATVLSGAVALPYLAYTSIYEDWEILRFLLPGLVPLLIVCADGFVSVVEHTRWRIWSGALAVMFAFATAAGSYAYLSTHNVFRLWWQEAKYPLVGDWFVRNTGTNAIAIASLHSGSIRQYSGRATIRWDAVPIERLSETVIELQRHGYRCYLVVDGPSEEKSFEQRFPEDERRRLRAIPVGRVRDIDITALEGF